MSSYNPPITVTSTGGTGGTSAPDVETVTTTYEVLIATAEYTLTDVVQRNRFYNTATPATFTDVWLNLTKNTTINTPPGPTNVKPIRDGSLTKDDLSTAIVKTVEQDTSVIFTHLGKTTDAAAAADGTGNYSLVGGIKRLVMAASDLLSRIPALQSGRLPVATEAQWETVEFRVNSSSVVVFEKEYNGTTYRQRTWTATVDAQGVTSYVAGAWA